MKTTNFKSFLAAAVACACIAVPAMSSAQRWPTDNRGRGGYNNDQRYRYGTNDNNRNLRAIVDRAERRSNDFREDFERQYRGTSSSRNRNRNRGNEQYGYWGGDLKSDIQRMDEAFERLRNAIDRNDWRNNDSRREVDLIVRISDQIDREFGRGSINTRRGGNDLQSEWRNLRRDISDLSRQFGSSNGGYNNGGYRGGNGGYNNGGYRGGNGGGW